MPGEGERHRPAKPLKARAVALLARREYSRAELRAKLATDGDANAAGTQELDGVLDELAALGYLSDVRFAKAVVRRKSGGYSKRAISAALKASGVGGETAADAIEGGDIDDEVAMIALWRRRFEKVPADDREKARQVRFLQSRGFALSAIFKLLRNPPADEAGSEETGNR